MSEAPDADSQKLREWRKRAWRYLIEMALPFLVLPLYVRTIRTTGWIVGGV